ncbi:hypothetical protein OS122_02460 [Mycolicibacterium mucogenicum]|uniref:hypothetical protein n=1 Tax=Mycolicibacterium mucogenicum TaxID=56689 RepID=UPI00226A718A|nr:hypothetical protein [Mycolicibacterium mucogenicum]MCX8559761.1 hypothetical protein [Mycolicibacterium mucogenicum]
MDQTDGFTLYGVNAMLAVLLGSTVYGRIIKSAPPGGTRVPSSFGTRQAITYGAPDSNGVYDITTPVQFGPFTQIESDWGIELWTAATAGSCFFVRAFAQAKNMYISDTGLLASLPITIANIGS